MGHVFQAPAARRAKPIAWPLGATFWHAMARRRTRSSIRGPKKGCDGATHGSPHPPNNDPIQWSLYDAAVVVNFTCKSEISPCGPYTRRSDHFIATGAGAVHAARAEAGRQRL